MAELLARAEISPSTITDLLERYLKDNILRPATLRTYRKVIACLIKDCGKGADTLPLGEITFDLLTEWRRMVLERASPATWNNYRTHLRALLNYAILWGWIETNPLIYVKSAPTAQRRKRTVPEKNLRTILALLNDDYGDDGGTDTGSLYPRWFWRIVLRTFYYSGMRLRQLVSLRWRDIDFARNEILLTAEGSKTRREWTIPLSTLLRDDLRLLMNRTMRTSGITAQAALLDRQVFNVTLFYKRYKGAEMTEAHVHGFFRRLSGATGIAISAHRMRHTVATELMRGRNPDVKAVQQLLGHTDIRTTLSYVETDTEQLRHIVGNLTAL
ncbi:hypothetical protein B1C78_00135 [Thioalkalivibrio denitrificans]|uniref:Integrase n=1 Tax=Thioalkalivibrio denitrificans TaxID=108003 RepID=A0A1V3NUT7_9GAMM|nr:site-specific integrase [Thioalkalivibrio denitrificans]OOG28791.1 hypothetical protein B1C78_00135 [Thioalkalivibrio denitrificans]